MSETRRNADETRIQITSLYDTGERHNDGAARWIVSFADGSKVRVWGTTPGVAARRSYAELARKAAKHLRREIERMTPASITAECIRVARLGRVVGEQTRYRLRMDGTWVEERITVYGSPEPKTDDATPRSRGGLTTKRTHHGDYCGCGDAATLIYRDDADNVIGVREDGSLKPDALLAPVCQLCGKPAHPSIAYRASRQAEREATRMIDDAERRRLARAAKALGNDKPFLS